MTYQPERELVRRPLEALRPYSRNARTHSSEQVAQLVASIQEFGFTNPLLIDEQDRLIAGHGRLEAARALGMASVPCIVVDAFGGSGSTLVAADRLGMCARLIELDPGFGDVIVRRWQNYTGRRAVRDDGVEFPQ